MYKTVYRERYGKLTIRERTYTLTVDEARYQESDRIPVALERMRAGRADRLNAFVQDYVSDHPQTDLVDRLTKSA